MDFNKQNSTADVLAEKWAPVLEHPDLPTINDNYKQKVTAVLLENQETAMREQALHETTPGNNMGGGFSVSAASSATGNLAGYDPVLISLVRRAMPNLIAYDIAGVQPMSAPTGLIFPLEVKSALVIDKKSCTPKSSSYTLASSGKFRLRLAVSNIVFKIGSKNSTSN